MARYYAKMIRAASTRRTNPLQWPGFTAPRIGSLDMTAGKSFRIIERVGFKLKMESYNLPNVFNGQIAAGNLNPASATFDRVNSQCNAYYSSQFQYTGFTAVWRRFRGEQLIRLGLDGAAEAAQLATLARARNRTLADGSELVLRQSTLKEIAGTQTLEMQDKVVVKIRYP